MITHVVLNEITTIPKMVYVRHVGFLKIVIPFAREYVIRLTFCM